MGEYRNHDCQEQQECCKPQNCCHPQYCCPDNHSCCGTDNSIWMIILIVIVICLLCNGDNKGGLFGGLF